MTFKSTGLWILSILTALIAVVVVDRQSGSTLRLGNRMFHSMWTYLGPVMDECLAPTKAPLLSLAQGKVVEIGPGHGSNFKYFAKNKVTSLIAVEPNTLMHPKLVEQAKEYGLDQFEIVGAMWENSNLEEGSCDAIISNLVLCSVDNLYHTLDLVHKYLKPGGKFIFIEHVGHPNGTMWRTMQNLVTPLWKYVGDNCHLNRDVAPALAAMDGWKDVELKVGDMCGSFPLVNPKIYGYATKV
ncbi:hypothetical protein K7432_012672 [Basidiobolus ranarum]|uniref:Methyltransferase type 11 domain-containing protein n=1 Tax=Basidiobolus ranarum TaxID=34480 RepID=A0ABR2VRW9_9FUNG